MKLTNEYLKELIRETVEEISTGTASDDVRSGMESEPTEEEMGKTVYVVFEDQGIDGTKIFGVFESIERANDAKETLVDNGVAEYCNVLSFNLNQVDEEGGKSA